MAAFEEDRFVVIPRKYVERLSMTARLALTQMVRQVRAMREQDAGEPVPYSKYYVVNRDEPYAEDVLNIILLGEERKEKQR